MVLTLFVILLKMNVGQDSDFADTLFQSRYNSDLANDLGNLLSRLLNMGHRFAGGRIPAASVEEAEERAVLDPGLN